jgi:hypothetical protein
MTAPVEISATRYRRGNRLAGLCVALAFAVVAHAIPVSAQTATAGAPQVPSPPKLSLLIRTTLIALNQANQTGNYTVLRDLAAPDFQRTNNPARLGEIFSTLRKRDLDLSPILLFQPKLREQPSITENGLLRLVGFFETEPEQVSFEMLFQPLGGDWRLFGLAVDVAPPAQAQAPEDEPEQETPSESRAEPGATRDSVTTELAKEESEPAPEPVFVPQRVSMPAPMRRPEFSPAFEPATQDQPAQAASGDGVAQPWPTATEDASARSAEETTEGGSQEDFGSSWSLWGN